MRYGICKSSRIPDKHSYDGPTWRHVTNKEIPTSFADREVAEYFASELSKWNAVGFNVFEMPDDSV